MFKMGRRLMLSSRMGIVLCLIAIGGTRMGRACPVLQNTSEIQSQFQLMQNAATWIPTHQEQELKMLFQVNAESLSQFTCYFSKGNDPNRLSDILSVLKLQILSLRYQSFKKDKKAMTQALFNLRRMSGSYLGQPSMMARRLGASVRSLLLDELERLIDHDPELVREEVRLGYWRSDLTVSIEQEIRDQWAGVKSQVPTSATPTSLARYFGFRSWKAPTNYRSRFERLVSQIKNTDDETLEVQLRGLFKNNSNNFDLMETERLITHYLLVSIAEIKKNNYFILKPWLDPVIDEKVRVLKSELGSSWALVSPLVGVSLEGPFKELGAPIELLDVQRYAQAKVHYARVRNPLGRLYEIVFLKRITQMWSQVDVVQMQSDLNRVSFLKTLLAVQDYERRFARRPGSVDELVRQKMIQAPPLDYFTGRALKYDPQIRQVWSVGENGIDEKGRGDDISLSLSI